MNEVIALLKTAEIPLIAITIAVTTIWVFKICLTNKVDITKALEIALTILIAFIGAIAVLFLIFKGLVLSAIRVAGVTILVVENIKP